MDFNLESYLPYLVHRVGTGFEEGFSDEFDEVGLNLPMWRVSVVLYQYGDQTIGALSTRTSINISTLSRLIGKMSDQGLVSRRRSSDDAREVTVQLRQKGRQKVEQMIPKAHAYEARLTETFSPAELATLKQLLVKLHGTVLGARSPDEGRLAG